MRTLRAKSKLIFLYIYPIKAGLLRALKSWGTIWPYLSHDWHMVSK